MTTATARVTRSTDATASEIRKLSTLLEASQALSGTLDLKAGLHRVLEILAPHGAVRSTVVLLHEETRALQVNRRRPDQAGSEGPYESVRHTDAWSRAAAPSSCLGEP